MESGLELLRDAFQELRLLQFELSPPLLNQEGLAAALRWLASHASHRWGVNLSFIGSDEIPRLDKDLAIVLFPCARELVYNVTKHAAASQAWIRLRAGHGGIELRAAPIWTNAC